jgi:hypothetical protein
VQGCGFGYTRDNTRRICIPNVSHNETASKGEGFAGVEVCCKFGLNGAREEVSFTSGMWCPGWIEPAGGAGPLHVEQSQVKGLSMRGSQALDINIHGMDGLAAGCPRERGSVPVVHGDGLLNTCERIH